MEIIGVLFAWFLILKTKRKWLWAGLFNIFAGIFASAGYLIPIDCKYNINKMASCNNNL